MGRILYSTTTGVCPQLIGTLALYSIRTVKTAAVIWKTMMYFCGSRRLKSYSFLWRGRGAMATDEEFVAFLNATRDREIVR